MGRQRLSQFGSWDTLSPFKMAPLVPNCRTEGRLFQWGRLQAPALPEAHSRTWDSKRHLCHLLIHFLSQAKPQGSTTINSDKKGWLATSDLLHLLEETPKSQIHLKWNLKRVTLMDMGCVAACNKLPAKNSPCQICNYPMHLLIPGPWHFPRLALDINAVFLFYERVDSSVIPAKMDNVKS